MKYKKEALTNCESLGDLCKELITDLNNYNIIDIKGYDNKLVVRWTDLHGIKQRTYILPNICSIKVKRGIRENGRVFVNRVTMSDNNTVRLGSLNVLEEVKILVNN